MPEATLVSALGCAVRIDTTALSDADAAEVGRVWSDAAPRVDEVLLDTHLTIPVQANVSLAHSLSSLSQTVTFAALKARRGQLWMLHAAGLADDGGRVVALVGPSGQGKTTASRTLAASYGYVSDETVGIAPDGTVFPYRKPLSVIEGSSHGVKAQRPPSELGLRPLPEAPLRLAALVLLDRRADGPDVAVVEECDLGDALPELIAQTSYVADLTDPLRTIASHVGATGGVRRVVYREAHTLRDALAPLFSDPDTMRPVPMSDLARKAEPTSDPVGVYRGTYLDALVLDHPDRVVLLQPDVPEGATLRLVSGIGPALWRSADGASMEHLVSAAVDAYGEPAGVDVGTAVAAAVQELCAQSVLTFGSGAGVTGVSA